MVSQVTRFNYPTSWKDDDDEEELVAQTIDLDERKENNDNQFFSTYKLKNPTNKSRFTAPAVESSSGVSYKNDGKIDVEASIDFFSKNMTDLDKNLATNKLGKRRDSGMSSQSMMRLQSYRSIQHEPSRQEQFDMISRSNYSALKSQIDRFTSPKYERAATSNMTMKRNNSEERLKQEYDRHENQEERSQFYVKSAIDYDETIYNIHTMKEKGFLHDNLPIRAG